MAHGIDAGLAQLLTRAARPLTGAEHDFAPLLKRIGDARFVLIGEASHGTHEFYRLRAQLTRRLIEDKGFSAVAVEGDWPDAYRVNRYVRGLGSDAEPVAALGSFQRFPGWMWRNTDVVDFVGWLRAYNDQVDGPRRKVGFYGLDLYSLHSSIEAVVGYLDKADPEAARRARARYACFEHFGGDPEVYGYKTRLGLARGCEDQVVDQLVELRRQRDQILLRDGIAAEDEFFHAEQNALLVKDAEQANELRRKGIGIMITGGVITLAGTITSIAFTVRGTEYEKLLLTTSEQYNVADCSSKVTIKPNSKCDQLGKEIARDNAAIDFDDRATRVAGAAIASGVIVTVIGGIIYRLGIKKLRSGEIARVRMQPMLSRGFSGLALTGRF